MELDTPSPRLARRRASTRKTVAGALLCAAAQVASAQSPVAAAHAGQHDFDFLMGRWHVHLRKLLHPLTGSSEWIEYTGTSVMTPLWDGRANMEEFKVASTPVAGQPLRIDAQTLRLYDPGTGQWRIYLADAAHGKILMPPTVGAFKDGRGEFFDSEDFGGRPIVVRYVWTRPTPTTARMEQSFSPDWGRTWELNWICDLTPQP